MKEFDLFLMAFTPFALLVLGLLCVSVGWTTAHDGVKNKSLPHIVIGFACASVGVVLCGLILGWAITLEPAVLERAR